MTREQFEIERMEWEERELEWWNIEFLLSVEQDGEARRDLHRRQEDLLRG